MFIKCRKFHLCLFIHLDAPKRLLVHKAIFGFDGCDVGVNSFATVLRLVVLTLFRRVLLFGFG
jgi:hypothetical protein